MRVTSPKGVIAVVAMTVLAARDAAAWDQATHRSIVKTAAALSPEVEAWVAASDPAKLDFAAGSADPLDELCRYHLEAGGPRDPAARAEQLFKLMAAPKFPLTPSVRANFVGQLAHYVADCAVPRVLYVRTAPESFRATLFAAFRDRQPVKAPIAASLRTIGAQALWGDDSADARSAAYRLAVNLVADVFALLPRPSGSAAASSEEVLVIGVVGLDNGGLRTGSRLGPRADTSDASYSPTDGYGSARDGDYQTGKPRIEYHRLVDQPSVTYRLRLDEGIQFVEWVTRATPEGTRLRLLVLNNDSRCAKDIVLKKDGWTLAVPGRVAPHAVRLVELTVPPSTASEDLDGEWKAGECTGPFEANAGVRITRRLRTSSQGITPMDREPGDAKK